MYIGCFGAVAFTVSSETVQTFQKMNWSSKANYHQHKVHGMDAVAEFTGYDKDKLTFEMELNSWLGCNPRRALNQLQWMYRSRGTFPLVINNMLIGGWWHIESLSREIEKVFGDGYIASVKVKVSLLGA